MSWPVPWCITAGLADRLRARPTAAPTPGGSTPGCPRAGAGARRSSRTAPMRCTSSIAICDVPRGDHRCEPDAFDAAEALEDPVVVDRAGTAVRRLGSVDVPRVEPDGGEDDLGVHAVGAHHVEPHVGRRRGDPLLLLELRLLGRHVVPPERVVVDHQAPAAVAVRPGSDAARDRGGRRSMRSNQRSCGSSMWRVGRDLRHFRGIHGVSWPCGTGLVSHSQYGILKTCAIPATRNAGRRRGGTTR